MVPDVGENSLPIPFCRSISDSENKPIRLSSHPDTPTSDILTPTSGLLSPISETGPFSLSNLAINEDDMGEHTVSINDIQFEQFYYQTLNLASSAQMLIRSIGII